MTSKNIAITDEGQIKFMSIPAGFVQQLMEPSEWHRSPYFKNFHRTDNPHVRLVFYFRGGPLTKDEGGSFSRLLETPPHVLSRSELKSLEQMIYEDCEPNDFTLVVAKTEKINDRDVLRLEGTWKSSDLYDVGIFIQANAKTNVVQELHFLAPARDYESVKHYFDEALKTILWRTPKMAAD